MSLLISFDPHRPNRSLRISKISNLRTGNCFDALVKTDVDLRRECSGGSSCDAADRLVCNRHRRTDALIVALRTAVFTQDLLLRPVTSTSSAKCHLRAAPYRASGFVLWPVADLSVTFDHWIAAWRETLRNRERLCRNAAQLISRSI